MTTTTQKFQLIDRTALKAKMDNKEKFHFWNVLTKEFYKPEANIAGAQWIPVDTITEKLASAKVAGKGETNVGHCGGPDCPSSKQAAEKLASFGYTNVFAYEGGLKDWSANGLPLVKR
ncbi:MAG: rhodanese-like domain-containing protein [Elusimicrobia bacterium]|nr:rhodanese-like domain-containing protein [Elusimicrobiota bacterium]